MVFACLLLAFACVCFGLGRTREQGALLGWVLTAVAVGLPLVYFFQFFRSVKAQAAMLDPASVVYTVQLGQAGVSWHSAEGDVFTPWNAVYGAWRRPGAVYLYVQQNRAYLLPAGQANVPEEEVWHFLRQSLPEERLHGSKERNSVDK